jgi:hypothetical protein
MALYIGSSIIELGTRNRQMVVYMKWPDVRAPYPNQWLLIEALEALSRSNQRRDIRKIAVIERCKDGAEALARYRLLHRAHPEREFYYVHTSRTQLDIRERVWVGIRGNHATARA